MSRACRTGTAIEEGPACTGGALRASEGKRWQLLRPPPYLLETTARPAQPWDCKGHHVTRLLFRASEPLLDREGRMREDLEQVRPLGDDAHGGVPPLDPLSSLGVAER